MKKSGKSVGPKTAWNRRFCEKALAQDQFSQQFRMKLDLGIEALPSAAGVVFSILLFIVVLGYTAQKCEILINKRDVDIMSVTKKDYYSQHEQFSFSQGLDFAVAFTGYDDETEYLLDPSIAELIYESYEFGLDEGGNAYERTTRLPTHACSDEELGIKVSKT